LFQLPVVATFFDDTRASAVGLKSPLEGFTLPERPEPMREMVKFHALNRFVVKGDFPVRRWTRTVLKSSTSEDRIEVSSRGSATFRTTEPEPGT